MRKRGTVWVLNICLAFTTGCASLFDFSGYGDEVVVKDKVVLELKGQEGRKEVVKYYSKSESRTFENQQIRQEKTEEMDFVVETRYLGVDLENSIIKSIITTIEKDGLTFLHDMAFPELGEELEMHYTKDAKVVKAGVFPRTSIFYVPPLSLPNRPVLKGDTWTMQAEWVSVQNSLPLRLDVVTILKKFIRCGKNKICAELEISGDVAFATEFIGGPQFKSKIQGVLHFSVDSGAIVWSDIKSQEELKIADTKVEVFSCLGSLLISPSEDKVRDISTPRCDQ